MGRAAGVLQARGLPTLGAATATLFPQARQRPGTSAGSTRPQRRQPVVRSQLRGSARRTRIETCTGQPFGTAARARWRTRGRGAQSPCDDSTCPYRPLRPCVRHATSGFRAPAARGTQRRAAFRSSRNVGLELGDGRSKHGRSAVRHRSASPRCARPDGRLPAEADGAGATGAELSAAEPPWSFPHCSSRAQREASSQRRWRAIRRRAHQRRPRRAVSAVGRNLGLGLGLGDC